MQELTQFVNTSEKAHYFWLTLVFAILKDGVGPTRKCIEKKMRTVMLHNFVSITFLL